MAPGSQSEGQPPGSASVGSRGGGPAATRREHEVLDSWLLARQRAAGAFERSLVAEARARDSMRRAHEREGLVRQVAGALLAATTAPAVLDLLQEQGLDPTSARVRLIGVDAETGSLRFQIGPDRDPEDAPPMDPDERIARAAIRTAERARLYEGERRFRATLEAIVRHMPVGVLVADAPSGAISLANEQARAMLGRRPDDWPDVDAYGAVPARRPDGRAWEPRDWPLARAVLQGAIVLEQEVHVGTPHGTWRRLVVSAVPIRGEDGIVTGAVQVLVDVTARREAEMAREAILGVLSHELRTPVTTILGASELLHDRWAALDEASRLDLLGGIAEESARLGGLIDNMLVLARIDAGVAHPGRQPVIVEHTLERVVAREARRFPATRFELELARERLPIVLSDEPALELVLSNLLSNAAKYGRPGGTVSIQLAEADDEVVLRVLDEGPGLASDDLPEVFRLFMRGGTAPDRASGAGIGLYVSARLMEATGGRIWVTNREAGGAEFGIALPVEPLEAAGA